MVCQKHDRTIYRIDISTPENQSAFQEFDIPGTPVVVAYNRGEEVERLEGAVSVLHMMDSLQDVIRALSSIVLVFLCTKGELTCNKALVFIL